MQHRDRITFDEFGNWYNSCGGYLKAAWLELLDHTKWNRITTASIEEDEQETADHQQGFWIFCFF